MPLTLLFPALVRKHFLVSQNGLKSVNNATTLSKVPFFGGKVFGQVSRASSLLSAIHSLGSAPSRGVSSTFTGTEIALMARDAMVELNVMKASTPHLSDSFPRSGDIAVVLEQKPAASLVGVRSHRLNLCELFRRMLRKLAGVRSSGAR
jgi:hypothetical protein